MPWHRHPGYAVHESTKVHGTRLKTTELHDEAGDDIQEWPTEAVALRFLAGEAGREGIEAVAGGAPVIDKESALNQDMGLVLAGFGLAGLGQKKDADIVKSWEYPGYVYSAAKVAGFDKDEIELVPVDREVNGDIQREWSYRIRSQDEVRRARGAVGDVTHKIQTIEGKEYLELSRGGIPFSFQESKGVTSESIELVEKPSPGNPDRITGTVLSNGKVISTYSYEKDKDPSLQKTYVQALNKGRALGIPDGRVDVRTQVVDGEQWFYPALKEATADIEAADTHTVDIKGADGSSEGTLVLHKVGDQVGQFFLPNEGKKVQNTFRTASGAHVVYTDGSSEDISLDQFQLGTPQKRGDSWFLETSPGSFSIMPESAKTYFDSQMQQWVVKQPDGSIELEDPVYQPGVIQAGDREFLQQRAGDWTELKPQFDPGIVSAGDMYGVEQRLLQQQTGAVSQIAPPTMDQIITQALVDGDFDKAMAFQDFVQRPTAMEAFQAAVAFARSPADQQLISSIARGETPVAPPPPGTVQRIGPAPDFLVKEYNTFQQRLRAGRPPTAAEQQQFTQRYQEGRSPLTDELEQQNAQMQAASTQQQANFELRMTKLETQRATEQGEWQAAMEKSAQKLAESNRKLAEALEAPPLPSPGQQRDTTTGVAADTRIPDGDRDYRGDKPHAAPTGVPWTDPSGKTRNISIEQWVAHEASRLGITQDISHGSDLGIMTKKGAVEFNRVLGRGGSMKEALDAVTAGLRSDDLLSPQTVINRDQRLDMEAGTAAAATKQAALTESGLNFSPGTVLSQGVDSPSDFLGGNLPGHTPVESGTGLNIVSAYSPMSQVEGTTQITKGIPTINASPGSIDRSQVDTGITPSNEPIPGVGPVGYSAGGGPIRGFAQGGLTQGNNLEIVGEEGPELVDLPPGTFVLPIKGLNQAEVARAKANGTRGYQSGGIVFQQLPLGLRQLQSGRAISQPRGYLSRAAGLTLPSAQAFQNITPESRDIFMDLASQAGIPPRSFEQELRLPIPGGRRQPTARILPLSRRGIR